MTRKNSGPSTQEKPQVRLRPQACFLNPPFKFLSYSSAMDYTRTVIDRFPLTLRLYPRELSTILRVCQLHVISLSVDSSFPCRTSIRVAQSNTCRGSEENIAEWLWRPPTCHLFAVPFEQINGHLFDCVRTVGDIWQIPQIRIASPPSTSQRFSLVSF